MTENQQHLVKTWIQREVQENISFNAAYDNKDSALFTLEDVRQAIAYTLFAPREVKELFQATEIECAVIPVDEARLKAIDIHAVFNITQREQIEALRDKGLNGEPRMFLHTVLVHIPKRKHNTALGTACMTRRGALSWGIKYHLEGFRPLAFMQAGYFPNITWGKFETTRTDRLTRAMNLTNINSHIKIYEDLCAQ